MLSYQLRGDTLRVVVSREISIECAWVYATPERAYTLAQMAANSTTHVIDQNNLRTILSTIVMTGEWGLLNGARRVSDSPLTSLASYYGEGEGQIEVKLIPGLYKFFMIPTHTASNKVTAVDIVCRIQYMYLNQRE